MTIPMQFILENVVHLLQCLLYVARGLDLPSFSEIILFEFAFEIIKKCTVKNQAIPLSDFVIPLSFDSLSMTDINSGIPLVRSVTIYRLCQALELEAILAPTDVINPKKIQTELCKRKQIPPTPIVYSFTLFKMCEALGIKVELQPENERPAFINKKKRQVPVVYSPTVFCFCKALQLDAQLANVS
ncbi:hypothetical protein TNIN_255731 [Trichonephila inaurata madagascariensis]|uniref:Uncharacterized protein n=1 Tax=Trichonephila inaurata madagascariensis TaxID=2747483 RepID=A0A8X6XA66_9ARAC|nr:hypothetical protein TNIN_255731 [Trichonephila inaurata madagascariensis]